MKQNVSFVKRTFLIVMLSISFKALGQKSTSELLMLVKRFDYQIQEDEIAKSRFCYNENEIWRYTYNEVDYQKGDTIHFFVTDTRTEKTFRLPAYVPNLGVKSPFYAYASSIAANDKYVVLFFSGFFTIFKRENDQLSYLRCEPIPEQFGNAKLMGDTLMVSKCYNFPRMQQRFKASFASYLIEQNTYLTFQTPEILGIPLTHLKPNNYITFIGNKFAVVDPTTYNIKVYDLEGNIESDFTKASGWDTTFANTNLRRIINGITNDRNVKPIIDSVLPLSRKINFVKHIYGLDDSTLIVNYMTADNVLYTDIYRYTNKQLSPLFTEISSEPMEGEITLINFPTYFRNFESSFCNSGFFQLREAASEVSDIEVKPKEYIRRLDRYFKDHDFTYKIYLFKPVNTL